MRGAIIAVVVEADIQSPSIMLFLNLFPRVE